MINDGIVKEAKCLVVLSCQYYSKPYCHSQEFV